jgi:hypothetical protein
MRIRLHFYVTHIKKLGTSEFTAMHYDFHDLIQPVADLNQLEEPFNQEEINNVIKDLKTGKSSSPDGFNSDFTKKFWPVIKQDFYDLCNSFFNRDLCLQSINGSYITMIPKMGNPSKVSDFRPIPLLNSSIKLITKLLVNIL